MKGAPGAEGPLRDPDVETPSDADVVARLERLAASLPVPAAALARIETVLVARYRQEMAVERAGPRRWSIGRPGLGRAAALGFAVLLILVSAAAVAAGTGPGQPFYHVRLAIEDWTLPPVGGSDRVAAELRLVQDRLAEIAAASARADAAGVADAAGAYAERLGSAVRAALAASDPGPLSDLLKEQQAVLAGITSHAPPAAAAALASATSSLTSARTTLAQPPPAPPSACTGASAAPSPGAAPAAATASCVLTPSTTPPTEAPTEAGLSASPAPTPSGPPSVAPTLANSATPTAESSAAASIAGSPPAASPSLTLVPDTDPPAITKTIGGPQYLSGSNTYVTSGSALTVNVSDAASGLASCTISLNLVAQACIAGDNPISLGGPDGQYTLAVNATDQAGNVATTFSETDILDNTAPALSPIVLPDPVRRGGTATATPNASDASGSGLASADCAPPGTTRLGPQSVSCTATDNLGHTVSASATYLVYALAPGGGSFVVGDLSATGAVMFWGPGWSEKNALSRGSAPSSFKGFARNPAAPACGMTWSTDLRNTSPPPTGPLPAYMAVIVTGSTRETGSMVSGDTRHVVVVRTDPAYDGSAGHPGTGTVVAVVC